MPPTPHQPPQWTVTPPLAIDACYFVKLLANTPAWAQPHNQTPCPYFATSTSGSAHTSTCFGLLGGSKRRSSQPRRTSKYARKLDCTSHACTTPTLQLNVPSYSAQANRPCARLHSTTRKRVPPSRLPTVAPPPPQAAGSVIILVISTYLSLSITELDGIMFYMGKGVGGETNGTQ